MEYDELKKLRHNAATDPLTVLINRRILEEYLNREVNRTSRYGSLFALLSIDLRTFKSVNDTFGHAAGDEILRSVARAILETIRGSDISCRIGGDEFAILLPQADRGSAEALAQRIARRFKQFADTIAPNTAVAIDYGIAIFPEDGRDIATLFAAADKTLYAHKHWEHSQLGIHAVPANKTEGKTEQPAAEVDPGSRPGPPSLISSPSVTSVSREEILSPGRALSGRRDERIRLEGSLALGIVLVGENSRTVRVLDLSRSGVCLLIDHADLPANFPARLQVPLAPGGELTLHRVYSLPLTEGKRRVGCSFTPIPVVPV